MCLYVRFAFRKRVQSSQNDLTREAMLTAPDPLWVADITYIRLAEEFV